MESFVVRIYQRTKTPTDSLVGVVEDVRRGHQTPFHGMEELWAILLEKRVRVKSTRPRKGSPPPHPGE
ncbi:MAG: hypothetical protein AB1451_11265 [Nitrospirota bacterium]